ncbi:UDP-N-acetylmuramoyl-tripeptide--D-alanyl-D-alanine ligase [Paenibacillus chitinolyticus]|uniref:UDP-N-acetylmuramoyl-tripeptide--D-alanyl-D- alanine ligase n=1 Tax=Paenibacillus chitinolyticus TaxID=79263 RepID=UPI0026E4F64D|nr:UDP-N-acetylmuramoyl-tripeptide--D-alanyl-D-alanine ligase [Paenibacillus chitinolyticus]GKS12518.1 UDP-N-acetylmuramoyl-tripeptide--D-alanyl-D-alanine ligase [Paenibacillus chitinolyticus]
MRKLPLSTIAELAGAKLLIPPGSDNGAGGIVIDAVSTDTRTIAPGSLFVPLVGERFDGHEFAADAAAKGASAALWLESRQEGRPEGLPLLLVDDTLTALQKLAHAYRKTLNVKVVGITGSNGKTTTKDMMGAVLGTVYNVHRTKGNLNNHIGLPLTLLQLDDTTEVAVVEMGMSGRGEIELLSKIAEPDIAVITMIGDAHLLQLGSREEIARAKTEILSGLKDGGTYVFHGDEPLLPLVLPEMKQPARMSQIRFGRGHTNDLYPTFIRMDGEGTHFSINPRDTESDKDAQRYYIPLLGEHNVDNALAAIAVGTALGVPDADIRRGLAGMQMTGMRIEKRLTPGGVTVLNDAYNASPSSMKASIRLVEQLEGYPRKYVVLADMLELGEDEIRYHREIGSLLSPDALTGVYAYGPLGRQIAEAAGESFGPERVRWFEDKAELTASLHAALKSGDLVLIKGSRGMKLEEVAEALLAK